jgi:hypothetical protein
MQRLWVIIALLAIFGLGSAAHSQAVKMDPSKILFSTPTLSNDLGPLEPLTIKPSRNDLIFHEDEWRQVEFLPAERLAEVKHMMSEYKTFEAEQRATYGWRNVYVRKLTPSAVVRDVSALEKALGVKSSAAPILAHGDSGASRVVGGFTLLLGGNVALYGFSEASGVAVLGAYLQNADDRVLASAFQSLNAKLGLILVDWRAQMILVSTTKGKIDVWKP